MVEIDDGFAKSLAMSIPKKVKSMIEGAGIALKDDIPFIFTQNSFYYPSLFYVVWEGNILFPDKVFVNEELSDLRNNLGKFVTTEREIFEITEKYIETKLNP